MTKLIEWHTYPDPENMPDPSGRFQYVVYAGHGKTKEYYFAKFTGDQFVPWELKDVSPSSLSQTVKGWFKLPEIPE